MTGAELNKRLEDIVKLLGRNAWTAVLNLDDGLGPQPFSADLDPAVVAIADGVGDQVDQNLADAVGVHANRRQLVVGRELQAQTPLLCRQPLLGDDLRRDRVRAVSTII